MKILIILVTIVALSAVIGSVIVGEKVFDGLVVEKPYEKGLQWDKTRNEKTELGWNVVLKNRAFSAGENDVIISVFDKDGRPLAGAQAIITISRPATTAYDKNYETTLLGVGSYKVKANFPLYGYWDLKVTVSHDKKSAVYEEKVYVKT